MPLTLLTLLTLGQVLGGPEFSVQRPNSKPAEFSFTAPSVSAIPLSSDTVALWRFDEANVGDNAVNAVPGGVSLVPNGGNEVEIGVADGARRTSFGNRMTGALDAPVVTAIKAGDATVEYWAQRDANGGESYGSHMQLADGSGAHYLLALYWAVSDYHLHVLWTYGGGGSSVDVDSTWVVPLGGWHHYAVTLTPTVASTCTLVVYVDGVAVKTSTALARPNPGGGTQNMYLGVGDNLFSYHNGPFDDLRITSVGRTADQVLADYRLSGRWSSPPPPTKGPSMTFARASTATYEAQQGHVINALSGEMRCGYRGCLIEPSRTNSVLRSEDVSNAAWTTFGTVTVTGGACAGADGTKSLTQLTSAAYASRYQAFTTSSSTTHAFALDVASPGGTAKSTLELLSSGPAPTSCTCQVLPSGTCTTGTASNECYAQITTTSTTPLHLLVQVTWASAVTSLTVAVGSGTASPSAGGTSCVGAVQVEAGAFNTSHIPTAGTAVTRVADVLSVASSVLGTSAASFRLTMFPEWASSVSGTSTLLDSDVASELALSVASDAMSWAVNANTVTTAGTLGWSALVTKTLDSSYSANGNYSATDGTKTALGTNPGNPTPATLYLGGSSTVGGGVYISGLKICKRSGTCQR